MSRFWRREDRIASRYHEAVRSHIDDIRLSIKKMPKSFAGFLNSVFDFRTSMGNVDRYCAVVASIVGLPHRHRVTQSRHATRRRRHRIFGRPSAMPNFPALLQQKLKTLTSASFFASTGVIHYFSHFLCLYVLRSSLEALQLLLLQSFLFTEDCLFYDMELD